MRHLLRHGPGRAHVAEDNDRPGGSSLPVVDRRNGVLDRSFAAVALSQVAVRRQTHGSVLDQRQFHRVRDQFPRDSVPDSKYFRHGPARRVASRPPCHGFRDRIEKGYFAVKVRADYCVSDRVQGDLSALFLCKKLVFRSLPIGDVGVGAKPSQDPPLLVANGDRPGKKSTVTAIPPAERKRIFPYLAGLKATANLLYHPLHVVGMMRTLFPTLRRHLLFGGPEIVKPTLVVPEDMTLFIGHPGQLRDVIRQTAEALLTFASGILRKIEGQMVALRHPACADGDHHSQNGSEEQNDLCPLQSPLRFRVAQHQ